MYKPTKTICILGCGWVGKALEKSLNTNKYKTICLSKNISKNNYNCDTLVIAIPPKENYLEVLEQTFSKIAEHTQVILLSSISYYDNKALVVEGEALVEKLCIHRVVLRLGGLMGYDRVAGKYTAGKTLPFDTGTNYVHRDDVVGIIESVIFKNITSTVFDVVAPIQSTKKQVFEQNTKAYGFEQTQFLDVYKEGKVLSPDSLCDTLGYVFKYEDVQMFWR